MESPQTTWADPSLAGLFSLGAGTTAVWAALTGRTGPHDLPILVVWLLAVAFVQLIAGLVSLKRGDPLGGAVSLTFALFFWGAPALTTAVLLYSPSAAGEGPSMSLIMNGWVFALLGIVLACFVPVFALQSALTAAAIGMFSAAVFLLAALNLQPFQTQAQAPWPTVAWTAGWLIGIAGLLMVYAGIAMAWLFAFGRSVLPMPGPISLVRPTSSQSER